MGRRAKSTETYCDEALESIRHYSRYPIKNEIWQRVRERIHYFQFDLNDDQGYTALKAYLEEIDHKYRTGGNRIFYFAVAPEYFALIGEKLQIHQMVDNTKTWQRVVIEKPFGEDLESAKYLNRKITDIFSEQNTYRIDHYLGKEMMQNIMVIRFANAIFEPLWNNKYIDNIQITAAETVGIENRAGYFEKSGVLRDMVQNHLMQLLMLIAMEPPISLETEAIRDEKVKLLRSIKQFTPEYVKANAVRGQYGPGRLGESEVPGYRQEQNVHPQSSVETFMALRLFIDNFRWAGMPFYIRTGKRLPVKATEVVIQFKQQPNVLYFKKYSRLEPSLLIIRIQPDEGIFLRLNAKKPGTGNVVVPVQMDFSQTKQVSINSPEAYERLLYDTMRGDSTLFTRWDEVEYSWRLIDDIVEVWKDDNPIFPNYAAGTWGPDKAGILLARSDRRWWNNLGEYI